MPKKTIEQEINEFFEVFDPDSLISFLKNVIPLFELYDVQDESDWVEKEVGKENSRNVRLIRTVYLISKISDLHAGKLASVRCKFKGLWYRMEDISKR